MARFVVIHSGEDQEMADLFSCFLRDSLNLNKKDLVIADCDRPLPHGKKIIPVIKRVMADCSAVIILLSQAFVDSAACMLELGAVWASCQNIYPIHVTSIRSCCNFLQELPIGFSLVDMDMLDLLYLLDLVSQRFYNSDKYREKVCRFQDEALELLRRTYGEGFLPAKYSRAGAVHESRGDDIVS